MPFFQEAEKVTVNGGDFVDRSNYVIIGPDTRRGEGIRILLDSYVQREAIHDSDSRGDLGCHPGTREEYIRSITSWGRGEWESGKRAFLMTGPAGAGKSAIARTCAYKLKEAGKLGASFFFYRPSRWNDPRKFISTIVYQLTARYPTYRDCIDAVILDDPLVLEKQMNIQFLELLVKPLLKPSARGHNVESDVVIIVDGLDECATVDAQIEIIKLITRSIHEQTTPFLWAFFSRPEPHITSAFSSEIATSISWTLPLTLSGNADDDIREYLRGSFRAIRAKYTIPASDWPSEESIHRLVSQSAGLFVYAATAMRYICGLDKGTSGLEERLRTVLELDRKSADSPFSALDNLYILVMMLIPQGVLPNTLSLLHLHHLQPDIFIFNPAYGDNEVLRLPRCCFALGLSSAAFHVAISNLYSVLEVTKSENGKLADLRFYHRSFQEFLGDTRRSKQYFIKSPAVHLHCLEMVVRTLSNNVNATDPEEYDGFCFTLQTFFKLVERHDGKLEQNILQQISQLNWSGFYILNLQCFLSFSKLIRQIPRNWRTSIIRPFCGGLFGTLRHIHVILMPERYEAQAYILGKGDKEGLIARNATGDYVFTADLPRPVSKKQKLFSVLVAKLS